MKKHTHYLHYLYSLHRMGRPSAVTLTLSIELFHLTSLLKSIYMEYLSNNVIRYSKLLISITYIYIPPLVLAATVLINSTIHFCSTPLDFCSPSLKLFRTLSTKTEMLTV